MHAPDGLYTHLNIQHLHMPEQPYVGTPGSCCVTWRRATGSGWRARWRRWSSRWWQVGSTAGALRSCIGSSLDGLYCPHAGWSSVHPMFALLCAEGGRRGKRGGKAGKAEQHDAAEELATARDQAAHATAEAEQLRQQVAELQAAAERQQAEAAEHAAALQAAVDAAQQASTEVREQLAVEQRRAAELEAELAAARQAAAEAAASLGAVQQRAADLESELVAATEQAAAATAEAAAERQRAAELEGELVAVRAAVDSSQAAASQQYEAQLQEAVTQLEVRLRWPAAWLPLLCMLTLAWSNMRANCDEMLRLIAVPCLLPCPAAGQQVHGAGDVGGAGGAAAQGKCGAAAAARGGPGRAGYLRLALRRRAWWPGGAHGAGKWKVAVC